MGHWCKICKCVLPNEKFSGKGHKNHICKKCSALPKEETDVIQHEDEIFGYLQQSNISKKNLSRLKMLSGSPNEKIADLANIVLEVGLVKPHKHLRLKFLSQNRKDLLLKLEETGLIDTHHY